jgi:peptidoglycan hydrolase-like protein with peptidoglycan-binding domain
MATIVPNGAWIWQLSQLTKNYLEKMKKAKIKRVYLKVGDDATPGFIWSWQANSRVFQMFAEAGIEVYGWAYVFDKRTTTDTGLIVKTISSLFSLGMKGFVFDVEDEIKDPATHAQLRTMLVQTTTAYPTQIGYTSFGARQYHPEIPWKMLNDLCAFAMPQIYFLDWTFDTDTAEVSQSMQAQRIDTTKPIYPIWSVEAGMTEAQIDLTNELLAKYPGSSVWRLPELADGELTDEVAYSLEYNAQLMADPAPVRLDPNTVGSVLQWQSLLTGIGYRTEKPTGYFDPVTTAETRRFQLDLGLPVTGQVSQLTWQAAVNHKKLPGWVFTGGTAGPSVPNTPAPASGFDPKAFAKLAADRCAQMIPWHKQAFTKPFNSLLGTSRYAWCGATQYYLLNEHLGGGLPLSPAKGEYTFALVQAWEDWAKRNGWLIKTNPQIGDIAIFDWDEDKADWADHIGCVVAIVDARAVLTAEGNTSHSIDPQGITDIRQRDSSLIRSYVRIPKGWKP